MSTCGFDGNADMYGVGIRIGFYIQWYSCILASWISRSEVPSMRISNLMFVSATFLATIIQTAEGKIRPVEVYISLLLAFGGYLYLVPLFIWRALSSGKPQWDPSRYPRVRMGKIFSVLNFMLLVSVSVFQLWFWTVGIDTLSIDDCPDYGFFLAKIRLDVVGFVIPNIVVNGLLLTCCMGILGLMIAERFALVDLKGGETVKKFTLQMVHTFFNATVATVVTVATEMTIYWNGINGVADISSAGQLIPLVIGVEMFFRVLYAAWMNEDKDSSVVDNSSIAGSLTDFPDIAVQGIE